MSQGAKRVLIVDDAQFMRIILKDILTRLEFDIVGEAGNGEEAVSKCSQLKPDVVTLDLTMPKMDGLQALKEILQHHHDIKIIICSASGECEKVREAIALGAKGFIVKPFNPNKVTEVFKRYAES